jgi:hypothetical protein
MVATRNLSQYAELHRSRRYGATAARRLPVVEPWIAMARPKTLLDYGAGQSSLAADLQVPSLERRDRYDPAIPELASIPFVHYDMIVCTDVLEHIDEGELGSILADIRDRADRAIFCIHLGTAKVTLPNGGSGRCFRDRSLSMGERRRRPSTPRPRRSWNGCIRESPVAVSRRARMLSSGGSSDASRSFERGLYPPRGSRKFTYGPIRS